MPKQSAKPVTTANMRFVATKTPEQQSGLLPRCRASCQAGIQILTIRDFPEVGPRPAIDLCQCWLVRRGG